MAPAEQSFLLISPHSDDIAFSVGGVVLKYMMQRKMIGITVFTKSNYFKNDTFGLSSLIRHSLPEALRRLIFPMGILTKLEVTRTRKRENLRYFNALGISHIDLNLSDAPLRDYPIPLNPRQIKASDGHISSAIRNSIFHIASATKTKSLMIPLGLGNHVDHAIVRDACRPLGNSFDLIYYEDLPYAATIPFPSIRERAMSVDPELSPYAFSVRGTFEAKVRNLQIYCSQVGTKEVSRITEHATKVGSIEEPAERLWCKSSLQFE
jgi:LmbE family N-acetylglucosaminyl deacetylase